MSDALVEALSDIEDPEIIKQILRSSGVNIETTQPRVDTTDQLTLAELFQRFFQRRQNRSPATRSQYKRTIPDFVRFAGEQDVETPAEISTALVDAYVDTLQHRYSADATIYTYTKNTRTWLQWLNDRNMCHNSVYNILSKDELGLTPAARDETLPAAQAEPLLKNFRRKRKGAEIHALTELLWNSGPRIGGTHSADLCDFDPQNQELRLRHRPESGTHLKNGCEEDNTPGDGERNVELSDDVIHALQLYIQMNRHDVTDEYGREPLFTTRHGRASKSTLRRWIYRATSCRWLSAENKSKSCDGTCDPDSNVGTSQPA